MTVAMQRPGLSIALDDVSKTLAVEYRATGAAAGLLIDRRVDDVPRLVRSLFAICQSAQYLASRCAIRAAVGRLGDAPYDPQALQAVRLEALRETALHILVTWPRRLDEARSDWAAGEVMRLTRDAEQGERLSEALAEAIFGCAPEAWLERMRSDPGALLQWMQAGETVAARMIAVAHAAQAIPTHPEAAADIPLARNVLEPALDHLRPRGLAAHLAARLVELARLAVGGLDLPEAFARCETLSPEPGMGLARIACSRGLLVHRAWVKDGAVVHYEISSPTDRAFREKGHGRAWLKAVAQLPQEVRAQGLADVLMALDPCVEYAVTKAPAGHGGVN